MPVAVPVPRHDAGATLRKTREGQRVPVEMPTAVVQVEPVLKGGVVLLELVAAAHDVEIGMPIPIRVEEHRVDVFAQTVGLKGALGARAERAVASLDEEPAGLPLGAPDVDVVAAVAVDVADGQGGAFARQEVRDQRLAVEVVEAILLVGEIDAEACSHVLEKRLSRRVTLAPLPPLPPFAARILLRQRERAIDRHVGQRLRPAIRPDDAQGVDRGRAPQPEVQAGLDGGLAPARGHLLQQRGRAALSDHDLRANPRGVGAGAPQHHLEVVVLVQLARTVSINRGRGVDPAAIYRNRSRELNKNHYLQVVLRGSGANTAGIGAKVVVRQGGTTPLLEQMPTRGCQSSVEPRLHFGLGGSTTIDSLRVIWPDRRSQTLTNVAVDRTLTLSQQDAGGKGRQGRQGRKSDSTGEPLFEDVTAGLGIDFTHQENRFYDFHREPLIPHLLSSEGPALAVGDVDGDGRDDIYVGGAKWQAGRLFIQRRDGTFRASPQGAFQADSLSEDVDAVFFDANGRSEEHTSELQSLAYLVCRLLLEKKKEQDELHPQAHARRRLLQHQLTHRAHLMSTAHRSGHVARTYAHSLDTRDLHGT